MPAMWIPKRLVEVSLINTAALAGREFITHCEIEYESRVYAAASEVLHSGRHVVMLAGPSASGKTTTAHKLAAAIRARGVQAAVVSMDNFFKNLEEYPRLPDATKDYENIHAVDLASLQSCLNEIIATGRTMLPEFDFYTEHRKEEKIPLEVGSGVCIVEGIHALNPLTTSLLPEGSVYRIYVGLREEYSKGGQRILPTRDIRLARRMVRDHKFRGHSLEKTIKMWPAVCAGEERNIKVFKSQADLLMDTSFSYEICVLGGVIAPLAGRLAREQGGETLNSLAERFSLCTPMPLEWVPEDSMLREFMG